MSAPFQRPLTQISWNLAAGVLLYRRFQLSSTILLGGSAARGSFGFAAGFSSPSAAAAAAAGAGLDSCIRNSPAIQVLNVKGKEEVT